MVVARGLKRVFMLYLCSINLHDYLEIYHISDYVNEQIYMRSEIGV